MGKFDEWFERIGFKPEKKLIAGMAWKRAVDESAKVVEEYLSHYPESIFTEPPKGQHGKTVDSCSASALRAVLPYIMEDIKRLAKY